MANIKITGYAELNATPDDTDLLEIVDDVAGTPTSKKITVANLKATAAAKGANADIISMTALTQIIRATGGTFDIAIGGAAGDDFTVDTNKLVVEGDTGNVGIGTASPNAPLTLPSSVGLQIAIYGDVDSGIGIQSNLLEFIGVNNSLDWTFGSGTSGSLSRVITIEGTGNVGIGTTAPGNLLAVNRSADGIIVDFESADVVEGNVSIAGNTTSYNAFVGSHYTQLKTGQKELPVGAVVISTGEIIPCEANIEKETKEETEVLIENAFEDVDVKIDLIIKTEVNGKIIKSKKIIGEEFQEYRVVDGEVKKIMKPIYEKIIIQKIQLKANHALDSKTGKIIKTAITKQNISPDVSGKEYFTYIDTTTKSADKAVYGVWLGKMSDDAKGMSFGKDDKPVYLIAQVGLFKVRVTDTQGDIEVGDFLESSSRLMEAQKQVSKQKESGTIAKAMINVDWSKVTIDSELGYKWKLIPAVF